MPQPLSGPGVGLPVPQNLYPASLLNGELQPNTNAITLAPGNALPVPRGTWWFEGQGLAFVQVLDPITGVWKNVSSARAGGVVVSSDGFTTRIANLTGCAVAAVVTAGGSNYVQATTTVTASSSGSLWQAVVGGALAGTSITQAGSGYGIAPLVIFPAPPSPGVPATGVATISNGSLTAITMINEGAGYPGTGVVKPAIYPNPLDPNYLAGSTITNAAAQVTITGAGSITAVLCTNNGAPFTTLPTLTIAGAGTAAAASIVQLTVLTGTSITSGGAGVNSSAFFTTSGGQPSYTPVWTNPATELTGYVPRPAVATLALSGTTISSLSTIIDPGMFAGAPIGTILQDGAAQSTAPTIALTLGGANVTVILQNLG
jgi:hypothetical protein